MRRAEVLDTARRAVTQDRAATHGKPEDTFSLIADLWTAYLGDVEVTSVDVAHMMVLLKVARAKGNPTYADNHVDIAGYGSCAAELAEDEAQAHDHMAKVVAAMQTHLDQGVTIRTPMNVEISDVE